MPARLGKTGQFVLSLLGGAGIAILYLVFPLMLTVSAIFRNREIGLWIALIVLLLGELVIAILLVKTTPNHTTGTPRLGDAFHAIRASQRFTRVRDLVPSSVFPVSLLIVLILQIVASLSLQNTVDQQEALYLYAGRQYVGHLLGRPVHLEYGMNPFLGSGYGYPVLGGALSACCGLEAVRLVSLFWMLCATIAVYALTRTLFGPPSDLLAAALFAAQGSVLFLSHYASYDALSLALVALAAVLALSAGKAHTPWLSLFTGILLVLGVVTDFIAVMVVPAILVLLAWQSHKIHGSWSTAVVRTGLAMSILGVSVVAVLMMFDPGLIVSLWTSVLNHNVMFPDPRLHLMRRVIALAGSIIALGMFGFLRLLLRSRRQALLGIMLLGAGLGIPTYHIYEAEFISLHKHLGFGLVFLAPLAGYAVAWFSTRHRLIGLALCLVVFTMGLEMSQRLYAEWPNQAALVQTLRAQQLPSHSNVLAEMEYEPRYYLQDAVEWNWDNLWYFRYADRSTGRVLSGTEAYKAAISDGYWNMIVLSYGPYKETAGVATAIDDRLRNGSPYRLVGTVPYHSEFGSGAYRIWRRSDNPASEPVSRPDYQPSLSYPRSVTGQQG